MGFDPLEAYISKRVTEALRSGRTHLSLVRRYFRRQNAGPDRTTLDFWVRASRNCPNTVRFFNPPTQAPPVGFVPLQGMSVKASAGFRQPSSHVLCFPTDCPTGKAAPQSILEPPP